MQLKRYWLSKFFIKNHASLEIGIQGVLLDNTLINWPDFETFPYIESHFFFSSLNWQANDIQYHYNWLSKNTASNAITNILDQWGKINKAALIHLANAIKAKMSQGYLRKNTFTNIQNKAIKQLKLWPKDIALFSFDESIHKSLKFLQLVVSWSEQHLAAFQKNYIDRQKAVYLDYFQSIESNPLTDRQQTSCITDEQNNLILAGAGTGKTSTMIGRVGYLLKSVQAKESDFLLLAFGKQAADEMKVRIKEKLNLSSIRVNTFHSLGLNIITSVESKSPNISELASNETNKQNWTQAQFKLLLAQSDFKLKVQSYSQAYLNSNKDLDGNIEEISKNLSQLIGLYKLALFDKQQFQHRLSKNKDQSQIKSELELLSPIYQLYQKHLLDCNEIDFEDMIIKAIQYVESNRFKSNWKHILVDEFQDISEPRARLIKALKTQVSGSSLFCVGDDWQAIYRFTGADISLTTQFASYFGATQITALDKTFRFNNSISAFASKFVMQNPSQLHKEMLTHTQVNEPRVTLHQGDSENKLSHVLADINDNTSSKQSVYILSRYKFNLPNRHNLNQLNVKFKNLDIKTDTFHASKGKESDHVIILGLNKGKYGFPSQKPIPPLLDCLLPKAEEFQHAEERRLFYVAITRTKHAVHLLSDIKKPSQFITELLEKDYMINYNQVSDTSLKEAV